MKTNFPLLIFTIIILMVSCGPKDDLVLKKEELSKMKSDASKLRNSIETLEKEIALLDPEFAKENAADPILSLLPDDMRHRLVMQDMGMVDGIRTYRFDILLRGPRHLETPFFET